MIVFEREACTADDIKSLIRDFFDEYLESSPDGIVYRDLRPQEMSERTLIDRAKKYHSVVWLEILRCYVPKLLQGTVSRAIKLKLDPAEAPTTVWETMETALAKIQDYTWRGPDSFKGWLNSIARHKMLNLHKREMRHAHWELKDNVTNDVFTSGDTSNPEEAFRRQEEKQAFIWILNQQAERDREIYSLYIQGYTSREIAANYNMEMNSIRKIIRRINKAISVHQGRE